MRGAAWAAACRLDPAAAVKRNAKAVNERHVSVRPAPEGMTYLTALLPLKEGVACYATLHRAAGAAATAGDSRGRGQVMADTLVERLTCRGVGWSTSDGSTDGDSRDAGDGPGDTVELQLVMTDTALLAGGDDPALLTADLSGPTRRPDWCRRRSPGTWSGRPVACSSAGCTPTPSRVSW